MSIDWKGYHRVILGNLEKGEVSFEAIQEDTSLTGGALTTIIGGLFAMKCVFSPRLGYFKITKFGRQYLTQLTSERRTQE